MLFLPSRRFFLVMALAAVVLAIHPAVGLAADLGILLLFLLDIVLARRLGAPELEVEAASRLAQGQAGEVKLEATNRSGRSLSLRLVLDIPAALAGTGSGDGLQMELGPGERTAIKVAIQARSRGRHRLPAVHCRLLSPLRLAWWQWTRRLDKLVEVIPGLKEVRSYRLLALHHHLGQAGLRNVRQRGEGVAFESLREYVRGDDPRHTDWKATARRGLPMVRQFEAERSQNLMLCIDAGRLMAEKVKGLERLDHALAAAVVLNEVARVWNDHVGVFAFSDRVHVFLPPGRHAAHRVPELLTSLQCRAVEPDYPRALMRLSRTVTRRSLLVFFGDVIDDEVSAPLAAQLLRLGRRHLPLFIALRSSDLFDASMAPVDSRNAAYRRAAATELVLARARTLARMRDRGIHVADVPPDGAVAAAVNRYIELKQRGAL